MSAKSTAVRALPALRAARVSVRFPALSALGAALAVCWGVAAAVRIGGAEIDSTAGLLLSGLSLVPASIGAWLAGRALGGAVPGRRAMVAWGTGASAILLVLPLLDAWLSPGWPSLPLVAPSAEVAYATVLAATATGLAAALGAWRGKAGAVGIVLLAVLGGWALVAVPTRGAMGSLDASTVTALGESGPVPPRCGTPVRARTAASVTIEAEALIDGTVIATARLDGAREGADARWDITLDSTWSDTPIGSSEVAGDANVPGALLDRSLVEIALTAVDRLAAEEVGIESTGEAWARHCRALLDGPTALRSVLPLRLLARRSIATDAGGSFDGPLLADWRGQIDWWVFATADGGELGLARMYVDGTTGVDWQRFGLQKRLVARLVATDPAR